MHPVITDLVLTGLLKGYCNSLMYFCMASRRCGIVVVGWYVGTLGIGICGTEHPNICITITQSQYSLQLVNVALFDLCALLFCITNSKSSKIEISCAGKFAQNTRYIFSAVRAAAFPSSFLRALPWAGQWHLLSPSPMLHRWDGFEPHGATSSPKSPHPPGSHFCSHRKAPLHPSTLRRLHPPAPRLSPPMSQLWPRASPLLPGSPAEFWHRNVLTDAFKSLHLD